MLCLCYCLLGLRRQFNVNQSRSLHDQCYEQALYSRAKCMPTVNKNERSKNHSPPAMFFLKFPWTSTYRPVCNNTHTVFVKIKQLKCCRYVGLSSLRSLFTLVTNECRWSVVTKAHSHRVKPHATQFAFDPRDKSTSSRLSNPSYLMKELNRLI